MHGEKPGALWMLINGGVTTAIAKEVDDGTQLVIEAILSSATDVSTAGTARIAGTIVSGIFMLTRHGRDVVLPDHTEMNVMPAARATPAATTSTAITAPGGLDSSPMTIGGKTSAGPAACHTPDHVSVASA